MKKLRSCKPSWSTWGHTASSRRSENLSKVSLGFSPNLCFFPVDLTGKSPSYNTCEKTLVLQSDGLHLSLMMVSVSQEEQRELPRGSNHLQRKLGEQIGSEKLRKEWGLFHLEKAGYIMGLQVYERLLETVATSCSSSLWAREEEIGLSSSLRVSIWKNFLPLNGSVKGKKKKSRPFFWGHQMENRVILVCVGFLEANICFTDQVHWVCISRFCL